MTQTRMTVGVIGIGVMGSAIAARLLTRDAAVHVHDRDPERIAGLVPQGAIAHSTPASLTAAVDTVILSLNVAAIVEQVVFGAEGVTAAASRDKLLIDMSSIEPDATVDMAHRLDEIGGMGWVDSPLSGGAPAALNGTLTLMLGGREADVERARSVLQHLAANMTHMGMSGTGQATKLINQVLCACTFLAVAEATHLALAAGVDAARIPAALANGRADSRILQEFMPKMAAFDYTPTGRIDNMLKDLEAVQRAATRLRAAMPLTGLVTELHRMLVAGGIGAEDSAAYMKLFDFGRRQSAG